MSVLTVGAPEWPAPVQITVGVLRLLLVAFFVFMAVKNLTGDAQMASDFERWGYPGWFRVATAWMQIAGALLLLVPATAFWGGLLLVGVMLGALGTHLLHDPPATLVSPVVFLALIGLQLLAARPRS